MEQKELDLGLLPYVSSCQGAFQAKLRSASENAELRQA